MRAVGVELGGAGAGVLDSGGWTDSQIELGVMGRQVIGSQLGDCAAGDAIS